VSEAGRGSRVWRRLVPPAPRLVLLRSRLTLDVHGADELADRSEPTMVVANFASPADPDLVLLTLPASWRSRSVVVVPEETSRWWRPVRIIGRRAVIASPQQPGEQIATLLAAGHHVLCFPEGRRSRDGFLAPFRAEFADVAVDHRVPVVPVGIRGSYAAVPEDARWPVRGRPRVSVRLRSPMRPLAGESAGGFASRMHDEVRRLIEEDASSWWATQRNAESRDLAPPASSWRRIWAQTQAPTAGGRPRRSKIWRT
jgi:1-acyl-sn-glycerol-3-phosphate acyltransferase